MFDKFPADEENFRLGVVEDVGHLRRGQTPVDGDGRCSRLRCAEEEFVIFRHILIDEGNAVAGFDPGGDEGLGDLA